MTEAHKIRTYNSSGGVKIDIEKLKAKREELGWSKNVLAKKMRVRASQVSRWEAGKAWPRVKYVRIMARFLGIKMEELVASEVNA
jgi:ribosome-binding protein aMBF1 (putative translation factor)